MESQPQNPEFKINPENFRPCSYLFLHNSYGHISVLVRNVRVTV